MIQPATRIEREQRRTKKSAPTLAATFRRYSCCCWCDEVGDGVLYSMKLEVVVEFSVETILMQQLLLLLLLLLLFWSLVVGYVIGVGITFCTFTISTNHDKLKKKYTGYSKSNFILAHIFKCCTEFTRHNTLPLLRYFALEAENFSSYFDYFQVEE